MNVVIDPDAREWTDLILDSGLSVSGTNLLLGRGARVLSGGLAAEEAPPATYESPDLVLMTRADLTMDQPTATSTGLPDESVDLVVIRSAYEGISELADVFTEAARVLRPGAGVFIADYNPWAVARTTPQTYPHRYLTMMFPEVEAQLKARHPNAVDISIAAVRTGFRDIDGWDVEDFVNHFEDYGDHQEWVAQGGWRGFDLLDADQQAALVAAVPAAMRQVAPNDLIRESEPWTVARGHKG